MLFSVCSLMSGSSSHSDNWYNSIRQAYLPASQAFILKQSQNRPTWKSETRKQLKRRSCSPKIFPYKVCVKEDRVTKDLFKLSLSSDKPPQKRPSTRRRTFSEIEASLELNSDEEELQETDIQINSEAFKQEIARLKRNLFKSIPALPKPSPSNALVLWKPLLLVRPLPEDSDGSPQENMLLSGTNPLSSDDSTQFAFDSTHYADDDVMEL